jgi:hypothetical protein
VGFGIFVSRTQLVALGLFAVAYRRLGLGQQSQREPLGLTAEAGINELTTASTSCRRHNVSDDAPRDFLELDASQIAQARSSPQNLGLAPRHFPNHEEPAASTGTIE